MDNNWKAEERKQRIRSTCGFSFTEQDPEQFSVLDTVVPEDFASRLCRKPPRSYKKSSNEIPFFVPHKKLLEKLDQKPELREPLTGFSEQQEKIRREVCKPYIPHARPEDEILSAEVAADRKKKPAKKIPPWERLQNVIKQQTKEDLDAPPLIDQLELIQQLRDDPKIGFFYMIYAVERSSKYFTPYALKLVHYKDLGKTYMTISASGVTQYSPDEVSFTPIEQWEREYNFYFKLLKIRSFVVFRKWKAFFVWRKSVSRRKFLEARNYLEKNLFISDPILSKALLEIKSMCSVFLDSNFFDNSTTEKLLLFYFVEKQFAKLEQTRQRLDEFRMLTKDIVNNACLGALLRAGYTPDDSNITIEQTAFGKLGEFSGMKFKMPKDGVLKMSYIEQARKRERCYRLSCFIHLIDYMQANMMHGLLINTYIEFIKVLKAHMEFLPIDEMIDNDVIDLPLKGAVSSMYRFQWPYYVVDLLILPSSEIVMDPSEKIFRFVIQTIQIMWEENIFAIKPLLSDPFFNSFTRPMINHKIEERISGLPPDMHDVLKQDPITYALKQELNEIWERNFDIVKRYCCRFHEIRQFYLEDTGFDENIIRDNRDCKIFRAWSIRYKRELELISKVIEHQSLGIFFIQLERFKIAAEIAPRGKIGVLEAVMPG